MPLFDHFRGPAAEDFPWTSMHTTWCIEIMRHLNRSVLPVGYRARPTVHLGGQGQVDVGTLCDERGAKAAEGNGAVATMTWAPPQSPVVVACDLADLDVFEIEVRRGERGLLLVAAIELVSPANKDRPAHRHSFISKVAACLQQNVSVVVIDVVTERRDSLHAELMDFLDLGELPVVEVPAGLSAIAYRAVINEEKPPSLEMWPAPLQTGTPLPTLPLWIARDVAVPLDLEVSYTAACESLRVP